MICEKCGSPVKDTAAFCPNCGNDLKTRIENNSIVTGNSKDKWKDNSITTIKIVSDPYNKSINFFRHNVQDDTWEDIKEASINSRLRENDDSKMFLPFKVNEIIDTIIAEYYVGTDKIKLIFEGTADEYNELVNLCKEDDIADKINLVHSDRILENARDILDYTKEIFDKVHPLIQDIVRDDKSITKGLDKVSDALKDIIPICIFGNYSAGKSTFINSLIGYEILPSGGDPVTAKVFEISRSKQLDRARIEFTYLDEPYQLLFDENECRVMVGNKNKDLIQEILGKIKDADEISLFKMVNITIDILNFYERKDRNDVVISNVVKIEVPFSQNGKLGQSHNEFVIFDTPGSNSNSNVDHEKVLMEALEGFSNGIPVWVSQYDSIDSVDNASLCEKLKLIEALDKRFTMIVINKADSVELPKNGLNSEDVANIMEFESVRLMYSSGIYFVSSVMGLGAKNIDGIVSEYLVDVFEEKERKFSDPKARSYKKLYEYNIMPEQMKRRALEYSSECDNLIYANSGLYCVEMEMEQFASKHAAYNKCQMVYIFLKSIIDETERRIAEKNAILEKSIKQWEHELDNKKFALVESLRKNTADLISEYDSDSKKHIRSYVRDECNYVYTSETMDKNEQKINEEKSQDANLVLYESELEKAKKDRKANLAENASKLFKEGKFFGSLKNLASEWRSDSAALKEKKGSVEDTKRDVDKATSDKLIGLVKKRFKENSIAAQGKLSAEARLYWQKRAEEYRDKMLKLITESDALTTQQRTEMSDIILNYEQLQFDDEAEKVFIKAKFLRGSIFGINFGFSEKINTKMLVASYNSKIQKNISDMSKAININCFESFKSWQMNLQKLIEENITIYNPELRGLTEMIRDNTDRIIELQNNQKTITDSFSTIESMMSWKVIE